MRRCSAGQHCSRENEYHDHTQPMRKPICCGAIASTLSYSKHSQILYTSAGYTSHFRYTTVTQSAYAARAPRQQISVWPTGQLYITPELAALAPIKRTVSDARFRSAPDGDKSRLA